MPQNEPTAEERERQREAEASAFRNEAAMKIMGLSKENERLRKQIEKSKSAKRGRVSIAGLGKLQTLGSAPSKPK